MGYSEAGVTVTEAIRPVDRAGLYVPGGRAAYPSTVLMTSIPARVAGVPERVLCVPPDAAGAVPAVTLAAALLTGVTEIYRVGGAQATNKSNVRAKAKIFFITALSKMVC